MKKRGGECLFVYLLVHHPFGVWHRFPEALEGHGRWIQEGGLLIDRPFNNALHGVIAVRMEAGTRERRGIQQDIGAGRGGSRAPFDLMLCGKASRKGVIAASTQLYVVGRH